MQGVKQQVRLGPVWYRGSILRRQPVGADKSHLPVIADSYLQSARLSGCQGQSGKVPEAGEPMRNRDNGGVQVQIRSVDDGKNAL